MNGQRNRQAERHADRASKLLLEHDETVVAFLQHHTADDPAYRERFNRIKAGGQRAAALAQAHALTALALRKVGGR